MPLFKRPVRPNDGGHKQAPASSILTRPVQQPASTPMTKEGGADRYLNTHNGRTRTR